MSVCWVITDGKAGMESQCLGLAEALGLTPLVKRVKLRRPWLWVSPSLLSLGAGHAISPKGDQLDGPPPDILIASGRRSVIPSLALREKSRGKTFRVQIQDPGINPANFDVVVVPRHDRLRGSNVLVTRGALHRANAVRLEAARRQFQDRLGSLPQPRIAVLVGGGNNVFRLDAKVAEGLADDLANLVRASGGSLMVTPSRRTAPESEAILRGKLSGLPGEVWDGTGENPYFGYLAWADAIVVTEDSVNMVTEAAATGKPVHVVMLEGGSAKFRRFHEEMRKEGVTRPFTGKLEHWAYPVIDEMADIATEIKRRLAAKEDRR